MFLSSCDENSISMQELSEENEIDEQEDLNIFCFEELDDSEYLECTELDPNVHQDKYCEIEFCETIILEENARCWVPQASPNYKSELKFKNIEDSILVFKVINRLHEIRINIFPVDECIENDLSIGKCISAEFISVSFLNEEDDFSISITMRDGGIFEDPNIDSYMVISNTADTRWQPFIFLNKSTPFLDEGLEYYEDVTIAGIEIDKVFSSPTLRYKYYYSQELGLIGFVDDNGEEWVAVE